VEATNRSDVASSVTGGSQKCSFSILSNAILHVFDGFQSDSTSRRQMIFGRHGRLRNVVPRLL
jgi:hypothetical protein